MELRRCSQFHYIRAIKAGSIQTISNVDCGRPALVFKTLQDIYQYEDSKRLGSISSLSSQDMVEDTSNGYNWVDRSCLLEEEKERDCNPYGNEAGSGSDSDDLNFESVTLQQLKKRCKNKKRKRLLSLCSTPRQDYTDCIPEVGGDDLDEPISNYWKSINSKRTKKCSSQSPSPVKSEPIVIEEDSLSIGRFLPAAHVTSKIQISDTDDSSSKITSFSSEDSSVCTELMELCKESSDKLPSAESEQETSRQAILPEQNICVLNEASYVNLESTESTCISHFSVGEAAADILEETLKHSQAVSAPTSKLETLDTGILELKNTSFSAEDSSAVCTEVMDLGKEESRDILPSAESQQTYVEASYVDLDHHIESTCNLHSNGGETLEDILKESPGHSGALPEPVASEMETLETKDLMFKNTSFSAEDSLLVCTEVMELCKDKSIDMLPSPESAQEVYGEYLGPVESTCGGEIVDDILKVAFQHSPAQPAQEDIIEEPVLGECCPGSPVQGQQGQIPDISGVQGPDKVLDNNSCFMDFRSTDDSCKFEGIINEDLPSNSEHNSQSSPSCNFGSSDCCSLWSPDPCLSPEINFPSRKDDDSATEKSSITFTDVPENLMGSDTSPVVKLRIPEKPQGSVVDSSEMDFPDRIHVCEAANEITALEMEKHLEHSHHPERLLSTRKAISPTSQEKLCKALKSVELNEDGAFYICKEKLQFGEDTESKTALVKQTGSGTETDRSNTPPKGLEENGRTNITMNPKQMTKIPKNGRKGSPPKGTRKVPNHSGSLPPPTIRSCSESAIAFSRRQMQDMESLAAKLMQELKSMKDIVEGNLQSETSPTTLLKYDEDEVKIAIKSATKAEETTRKWLSIMSRDCNRFCKLMSSNGKPMNPPTGNTLVRKERRKISFADEAGGTLCHVKVFEDNESTLLSGNLLEIHSSNGKLPNSTGNTIVWKERRKIGFADEAVGSLKVLEEDERTPSLDSRNEQIVQEPSCSSEQGRMVS